VAIYRRLIPNFDSGVGPTALGRIPGFTEHIFPQDSRPFLSLVANIGLVLFLFLVGLEIDGGVIKRNAKLSVMVAGAGMVLPFGAGVGLAKALYDQFVDDSVEFTHFMLFVGVAFSITAFPVLCRILTELKLLDTTVGIVVLSAGVGNDISMCPIHYSQLQCSDDANSWLGTFGAKCSACQCRLGSHCSIHITCMCSLDTDPPISGAMGIGLAGAKDWVDRERANNVFYDRDYSSSFWFGILYRHHWCSCDLWCVFTCRRHRIVKLI